MDKELVPGRGNWSVEDGKLNNAGNTAKATLFYGNMDWEDYSVEATVQAADISLTKYAAVLGRCASSGIYYQLGFNQYGLSLSRRFNDNFENLGNRSFDFLAGEKYTLRLEMKGNRIVGLADTGDGLVERIVVQDDMIPFGCGGLESNLTSASFDDFKLEEILTTQSPAPEQLPLSSVEQNKPNPLSGETMIPVHIRKPAWVQMDIVDASGRVVGNLFNGRMEEGIHSILWKPGMGINAGLYFYVMQVLQKGSHEVSHIKMIVQ
jgi:hypothetical protein